MNLICFGYIDLYGDILLGFCFYKKNVDFYKKKQMATCGYICPKCSGTSWDDNGDLCDWCIQTTIKEPIRTNSEEEINEWIKTVHEGKCCADE